MIGVQWFLLLEPPLKFLSDKNLIAFEQYLD